MSNGTSGERPTTADGAAGSGLSIRILGPLEAHRDGRRIDIGPFKQRLVLGMLLARANTVVSTEALCDAVWPNTAPRTAHKNLQVYICGLRKALAPPQDAPSSDRCRIVHRLPGYVIEIDSGGADVVRFDELARAGRLAARSTDSEAARILGHALRLWRGPCLADLATAPAAADEAARLNDLYLDVFEDWAEAKLALGQHADVVHEAGTLARRHPFRERLRRAEMLALYRCGRHTEALARFDALRQALARELGLEPSPVLTRLYESMLTGGEIPGSGPIHGRGPTGCATSVSGTVTIRSAQRPGPGRLRCPRRAA